VRSIPSTCLLVILLIAGQPCSAVTAPAVPADGTVTIYRCVDAKGHLSLQDEPCPKDSQASTRSMVRPKDAPARPAPPPQAAPNPEPPSDAVEYQDIPPPPPPMYQCTSYDGIVRESEVYDPNPHCEPLALYFPYPQRLTPAQAGACRWVQDSCVRLSDEQACAVFRLKKREAASALLRAFSDTEAYRKSELQRLTQIIDESCR